MEEVLLNLLETKQKIVYLDLLGSKTVSDDTAAKIGRNSTYDIDKPPAVDMAVVLDKEKTAYVYNDYQESISNLLQV